MRACELGHLPNNAKNRKRRRNGLMILSAVGATVSARLLLTDFHKVSLLASVVIQDAEDSKAVMSGAAATFMSMLPLIDLMEPCVEPNAPSSWMTGT